MNYPWRISVAIVKVTLETVECYRGRAEQKLPVLARISNLFHHLRSCEQGIEVCLADRPRPHIRSFGFAIKRNAHLCLFSAGNQNR